MKSAVAGIVEGSGGIRVVVGPAQNMHCHVADGERIFIVHGLRVQEPVPWDEQAALIDKVVAFVRQQLSNEVMSGRG